MANTWEQLDLVFDELLEKTSGKTILLWGYDRGGWFIEHYFRRNNRSIEYIVDQKGKYLSPYFIRKLDPEVTVVILSFSNDKLATEYLESLGYVENKSFFYVAKMLYQDDKKHNYLSYLTFLEETKNLDFISAVDSAVPQELEGGHIYGVSIDYSIIDIMDSFSIKEEDAIFDFGFGKGASLIMFHRAGFKNLGGVEYDKNLWEKGRLNLSTVGINTDGLLLGDARDLGKELDSYNYFYMYDPFEGKLFSAVLQRIVESYHRRNRDVYLIYAVPNCHELVLGSGEFRLCKQIKTDFFDYNTVNIYCIASGNNRKNGDK